MWKNNHTPQKCRFKSSTCHKCGKAGHIAPACRSTQAPTNAKHNHTSSSSRNHSKTKYVSVEQQDTMEGSRDGNTEDTEEFSIYTMSQRSSKPIVVEPIINDHPIKMEVDTGAAVSIVSD